MVFIVLGTLILALITYLLFAPLFIEIDSTKDLLRFRFHYLAGASMAAENDSLWLHMWAPFWQKDIDLLNANFSSQTKPARKKVKRKRKPAKPSKIFRKSWAILKSFRLMECILQLNTGNMAQNGLLYPGFYFLSRLTGRELRISFYEQDIIILKIKNNMARMLWAYIRS